MKTWLITGCSSGIGREVAKAVLKSGDNAIVTARNISTIENFMEEYKQNALALALDVTSKESIDKAIQAGIDQFGSIDYLVNNAGYGYRSSIEEGDEDDVAVLFETNFFGPIYLIKSVLPFMRKQRFGGIINVSSIAAVRSGVGSGYYAASKAALELMTDGLYKEVTPLGIKVMIVEPGAFRTKFYDTSLKGTANKIDDYAATAWKTRKENIIDSQDQLGNPNKAGQVIVDTIKKDQYPKCLLLGTDAVRIVTDTLAEKQKEIEHWQKISKSTDY